MRFPRETREPASLSPWRSTSTRALWQVRATQSPRVRMRVAARNPNSGEARATSSKRCPRSYKAFTVRRGCWGGGDPG